MTTTPNFRLEFPDYFDGEAALIETRGYFVDLRVTEVAHTYRISCFDPVRLAQEVADQIASQGFFAEANLVVIPKVTRSNIEHAVARLANRGFPGLAPDE